MSLVTTEVIDHILRVERARSLDQAVILAYEKSLHTFQSSPWFVDVKDRFRIFEFGGREYIAKRTRPDKAYEEIKRSQQAFEHLDGKSAEGKTFRIILPTPVAHDESTTYLVSEYMGTDLNGLSYTGGSPQLTAQQYVRIVQFFLEHGVAHPGFLPRNIVEKGETMFLFDWEDGQFPEVGDSMEFDRLWYTNFILNWSYLFPKEELEKALALMLNGAALVEPPLVRYERTFRDIVQLDDSSITHVRDAIEQVVFGAELPVKEAIDHDILRPNDLGHLLADIFFDEMDVMCDMASKAVRTESEGLYAVISGVISQIISLCRRNNLEGIQYYATVGVLLLIDFHSYGDGQYIDMAKVASFAALADILMEANAQSLAAEFVNGTLHQDKLEKALRACVEAATGTAVSENSEYLARIVQYVDELQGDIA